MKGQGIGDKSQLRFSCINSDDAVGRDAFAALTRAVFDVSPSSTRWQAIGAFDGARCVAGLEARILPFVFDGAAAEVAGLRLVAVDAAWRGRGLMRALMERALRWCDARADLALLYAAEPELYGRFGFELVRQQAFAGPAPSPQGAPIARALDLASDAALVTRMLAERAPVSHVCAMNGAPDLWIERVSGDDAATLAYSEVLDAILVHEGDDEELTLVDLVAPAIPAAAAILGALGVRPRRLKTLFAPDRLAWRGEPIDEDTGLMARGARPAAMGRAFMLPPTTEF